MRLVLLLCALSGCGAFECHAECYKIRDQLTHDFGAVDVNCEDPKWSVSDCAACQALLERDYGVLPIASSCSTGP